MNILLLGSGGREHALAMKIAESSHCDKLFTSPGNPGTANCGQNISLDLKVTDALIRFLDEQAIDMIVAGPEQPLVDGLHDTLKDSGALDQRIFFGPQQKAAQLEGSKEFAKEFMFRHNIPTAAYKSFSAEEVESATAYLREMKAPYVIKADGLAAGKGVIITSDLKEAEETVRSLFDGSMGEAGKTIVLEEFLDGNEFSIFVMTNGKDAVWLPEAKDYKRIGEGDTGPNTGGMGSVSPVPFFNEELRKKVEERIVAPTISGLDKDDLPFLGFVFFGLISVQGEPYVIEYNVRMGDPETQSVLPRIEGDLVEAMWSLGKNEEVKALGIKEEASASVVLVSAGYPGSYPKGKVITQKSKFDKVNAIHAGTKTNSDGELVTNGGRVIALNSIAPSFSECLKNIYEEADRMHFEGMQFRKDIGSDL